MILLISGTTTTGTFAVLGFGYSWDGSIAKILLIDGTSHTIYGVTDIQEEVVKDNA